MNADKTSRREADMRADAGVLTASSLDSPRPATWISPGFPSPGNGRTGGLKYKYAWNRFAPCDNRPYETYDAGVVAFTCRLRAGAAGGPPARTSAHARSQESETAEARAPDGDYAGVPRGAGCALRLLPRAGRFRRRRQAAQGNCAQDDRDGARD